MLVLPKNSSLRLMDQPPPSSLSEPGCLLSSSTPARYRPPEAGAWLDPGNWSPSSEVSPRPHSDQVPCLHDRAVFPPDMAYKVSITDTDVTVAGVSINKRALDGVRPIYFCSGHHFLCQVGLRAMFRTKVGSLMFNVTRRVSVTGEQCRDPRGCECGTSEHAQTVCGYVVCPPATCSSPLRPQGHCCYDYCGAVITVRRMSRGLTINTLTHLAEQHAGQHTRVYVRRLGDTDHQVVTSAVLASH